MVLVVFISCKIIWSDALSRHSEFQTFCLYACLVNGRKFSFFAGRLLQLLLGCAVNCDQKQLYIENIMNMEESVQQLIMQAIQELLEHQVKKHISLQRFFGRKEDIIKRLQEKTY